MQRSWKWMGGPLAALLLASSAWAADHLDGPAASADPAADITDVYAWMNADATRVNIVMNVHPAADAGSKFSDKVQYVIHTTSRDNFRSTDVVKYDILCTFSSDQTIKCWAGEEFITGDASGDAGLTTESGGVQVFAGLRNDPFFFNLNGFKAAATLVTNAKDGFTKDAAGCPAIDGSTVSTLIGTLASNGSGGPGTDFFLGLNTLSIIVSVDKTLLNTNGDIVSVWGSTNRN